MANGRMTRLTQKRAGDDQQFLVIRAMRDVTVHAVLAHRCVLPQERTALLGVAGVALVVDRDGVDHLGRLSPVRVVAVVAGDLAFADRMV